MIDVFQYDGGPRQITLQTIDRSKPVWVDITNISDSELAQVKEIFNLHPLTGEDIQAMNVRIKVEEFPEYLFCVFYGIMDKGTQMVELDVVIGPNFVITNHKEDLASISELKVDSKRLDTLFQRGPDFIFHRILDMEVDHFFPMLEKMEDEIEQIEEHVTRKPEPKLLSEILNLKRKLINIRKYVFQQRDKLSYIAKNEYPMISRKAVPYFRDVYDHAIRVHDSVESYKETLSNTFEAYMLTVSNNLNEVMKVLSVIATLVLPLTAVSSIYGMNFAHMPGQDHPLGFWFVILFMATIVTISLIYFKKKKWF